MREYDPRFDSTAGGSGPQRLNDPATWAWTENPAIHRLNYVLGVKGRLSGRTLIGMGKPISAIDLGSHIASANVCDATRKGKKTYACSLYVQADDDHTEILREIEDAMAGYGMNRYGLSGVLAGAPQLPVMNIGPIDIRGDEGKQITPRKSAFELFNSLSGQFTSKESHWKPESLKTVTVNTDIATDGRRREGGNDFLQVTDPDIGQYLLNIRYRQQRKGGAIKLPVSRRAGLKAEIGSWVTFAGKTWLVTGRGFDGKLRFTLQLSETGADIYDDEDIEPGPIVIPPTPPVNPSILTTVQNFTAEVGMVDGPDGYEVPALRFKWTPPDDPTIIAVRFEYFEGDNPTGKTVYTWRSDAPESGEELTSANVAPAARYTARATIVTVPDRFKSWTAWFTTVDHTGEVYYPGLVESIDQHTAELLAPMNVNLRDLIETARNVAREALNQDAGQYLDRQSSLTKISSTYDNVTAEYQHLVQVATGPNSALGLRIETIEVQMPGKADLSALNATNLRVTDAESALTIQGGQISGLQAALPGKADVAAVNQLQVDLTDLGGVVTAQGSLINGVEAKVDGVSASGLFRTAVVATETGALSTIGLSAAATANGATSQAAMLMSARSDGKSMIGWLADMVYFKDPAGRFDPFVIEGNTAYFNNARIRNLTAQNITAEKIDAALILQNGSVIEDLIDVDTFSRFEPIVYSFTRTVSGGQGYAEGNWTLHGTVIVNKPADKPCVEFMSVEAYGYRSGSGGNDSYIVVKRGGNGTVASGEIVVEARVLNANNTVTNSKTIMRGGLLGESSIRYDIWTWNAVSSTNNSTSTISVKCDSGVWVFR